MLKNLYNKIKSWFKYSESIFLARIVSFGGFATAVIASMDVSPLASIGYGTSFNKQQLISMGVTMLFGGVIAELARRRNSSL